MGEAAVQTVQSRLVVAMHDEELAHDPDHGFQHAIHRDIGDFTAGRTAAEAANGDQAALEQRDRHKGEDRARGDRLIAKLPEQEGADGEQAAGYRGRAIGVGFDRGRGTIFPLTYGVAVAAVQGGIIADRLGGPQRSVVGNEEAGFVDGVT